MPDEVRRVPPADWSQAARTLSEAGHRWFDVLDAVDEVGRADAFRVVLRVAPEPDADGVRLETMVPRDAPELASLGPLWAGAVWHERELTGFFGLRFVGGDDRPLLVRPYSVGHPARRDAVLAARVVRPWPGAKEPGDAVAAGRRRVVPPGVPDPQVWGERTGPPAEPGEVAASVTGGRVRGRGRP